MRSVSVLLPPGAGALADAGLAVGAGAVAEGELVDAVRDGIAEAVDDEAAVDGALDFGCGRSASWLGRLGVAANGADVSLAERT